MRIRSFLADVARDYICEEGSTVEADGISDEELLSAAGQAREKISQQVPAADRMQFKVASYGEIEAALYGRTGEARFADGYAVSEQLDSAIEGEGGKPVSMTSSGL